MLAILLLQVMLSAACAGPLQATSSTSELALEAIESCRWMFGQDVEELIAIPSISSSSGSNSSGGSSSGAGTGAGARPLPPLWRELRSASEWVRGRLEYTAFQQVQTLNPGAHHPVVYGEWVGAQGKPTVLIYGHYDVQGDPACMPFAGQGLGWRLLSWLKCLHIWQRLRWWWDGPFVAKVQHGWLHGRGVNGGKGAMLMAVQAVEALMRARERQSPVTGLTLPLNVKFLLESQGEIGSPDLPATLSRHAELLRADLILSTVGPATCAHASSLPGQPPLTSASAVTPSAVTPAERLSGRAVAVAAADGGGQADTDGGGPVAGERPAAIAAEAAEALAQAPPACRHEAAAAAAAAAVAAAEAHVDAIVAEAWEEAAGTLPPQGNWDAGGLPALQHLRALLGVPVAVVGWDRGERTRAQGERVRTEVFDEGREVWVQVLLRLAEGKWAGTEPGEGGGPQVGVCDEEGSGTPGDVGAGCGLQERELDESSVLHTDSENQGFDSMSGSHEEL